MATLRYRLSEAEKTIAALRHDKRCLQQELDRQREATARIFLVLSDKLGAGLVLEAIAHKDPPKEEQSK